MKVFISWSGDHSRDVAEAIREWLPELFDNLQFFMSKADIPLGERGLQHIEENLAEARLGLVVVTKENATAPWINFEAGALSKVIDEAGQRVIPLLIDFNKPTDLAGPLAQFQLTLLDRDGMREVVKAIARELQVDVEKAGRRFDRYWPDLEDALAKAKPKEAEVRVEATIPGVVASQSAPERSLDDKVDEMLQLLRDQAREARDVREEVIKLSTTYTPRLNAPPRPTDADDQGDTQAQMIRVLSRIADQVGLVTVTYGIGRGNTMVVKVAQHGSTRKAREKFLDMASRTYPGWRISLQPLDEPDQGDFWSDLVHPVVDDAP